MASDSDLSKNFANVILERARKLKADHPSLFFGQKLLIYKLWAHCSTMDMVSFKESLLEANRLRHLSLTRCDMPQLFDPDDIKDSEINSYGASFHFLVVY